MENHAKLTVLGVILLITTIAINHYHQNTHPGEGFNFAYITGIAMVIVFMTSFIKFNYEKLKKPKK